MTASQPLKLLLIEDEEDDALLLVAELHDAGFDTVHRRVDSEAELRDALDEGGWQIVISDYNLPGFNGLQALDIVRSRNADLPFFFISGTVQDEVGVRAMARGANDYLLKGNLARLAPAIRRELDEAEIRRRGRISAKHYASILDSASDAIITVDETFHIIIFNRAAERIFGYSAEEALGQPLEQLIPETHRAAHRGHLQTVLEGRRQSPLPIMQQGQLSARRKDGSVFPVEISLSCTQVDEAAHFTAILRDITERRRIEQALQASEAALRRQAGELENRVAERTAELEQARQQAERLAQAKSVFLANMSHEIRTPMNAVLGLAYLLQQENLPGNAMDLARKIHRSGQTLLGIINDILDFSKIESGQLAIEREPFHLNDILDTVATIMTATATDKAIELVLNPSRNLPDCLVGDALRLQQVLINLTSNAIKFTQAGEVEVRIELAGQRDNRADLRFIVRDTGIGMDSATQARLFQPFAQADASITRRFGGTGLGLAISRRLVELMGGRLSVDSTPGVGSTFQFELSFESAGCCANPDLQALHMQALVVDDNPFTREGAAATIASLGWSVETLNDGRSAIDRVLSNPGLQGSNAIILLDWQMPDLDGLATAAAIHQALPEERRPLLVIFTGKERNKVRELPFADQVADILDKPLSPSSLFDTVSRARRARLGQLSNTQRGTPQHRLAGLRLLVVDDSEINREVAQAIFSQEGATVELTDDGQSALNWLAAHPDAVDVVLMDVQMPGMDGYQATRCIRQSAALRHLPVIALTAGALDEQRHEALACGMDDFLSKPFNVDAAIATLLRHSGPRTDNPAGSAAPPPTAIPAGEVTVLDRERGLGVWRNEALYQRCLRRFAQENAGIAEAIASAAPEAASQLAHKLKGVAGNLALGPLAQQADKLERCLKRGDNPADLLPGLHTALAQAIAAIVAYAGESDTELRPATAAPATLSETDRIAVATALQQALSAFADFDPGAAGPVVDSMAAFLNQTECAPLEKAIDDFDAPAGLRAVRDLAAALGIPLEE